MWILNSNLCFSRIVTPYLHICPFLFSVFLIFCPKITLYVFMFCRDSQFCHFLFSDLLLSVFIFPSFCAQICHFLYSLQIISFWWQNCHFKFSDLSLPVLRFSAFFFNGSLIYWDVPRSVFLELSLSVYRFVTFCSQFCHFLFPDFSLCVLSFVTLRSQISISYVISREISSFFSDCQLIPFFTRWLPSSYARYVFRFLYSCSHIYHSVCIFLPFW